MIAVLVCVSVFLWAMGGTCAALSLLKTSKGEHYDWYAWALLFAFWFVVPVWLGIEWLFFMKGND